MAASKILTHWCGINLFTLSDFILGISVTWASILFQFILSKENKEKTILVSSGIFYLINYFKKHPIDWLNLVTEWCQKIVIKAFKKAQIFQGITIGSRTEPFGFVDLDSGSVLFCVIVLKNWRNVFDSQKNGISVCEKQVENLRDPFFFKIKIKIVKKYMKTPSVNFDKRFFAWRVSFSFFSSDGLQKNILIWKPKALSPLIKITIFFSTLNARG